MTGKKSYKEKETEQKFGKKRYLERVIEEQEAEQEIKDYDRNEDITDEGGADRLDGLRSVNR